MMIVPSDGITMYVHMTILKSWWWSDDRNFIWANHSTIQMLTTMGENGTSCTSLVYGFMKLVRRGDNPNKKTLIVYLMSHVTIARTYITRVAPK